jgi:hypothetical protein
LLQHIHQLLDKPLLDLRTAIVERFAACFRDPRAEKPDATGFVTVLAFLRKMC